MPVSSFSFCCPTTMDKFLSIVKQEKKHIDIEFDNDRDHKRQKTKGSYKKKNEPKKEEVLDPENQATGFTYSHLFQEIRPRKKIKREDLPDPETKELTFCPYDAEYGWNRNWGTIIRWYANIDVTNASICVQMYGFQPHFMILFPSDYETETCDIFKKELEKGLVKYIEQNIIWKKNASTRSPDIVEIYNAVKSNNLKLVKRIQWRKVKILLDQEQVGTVKVLDVFLEYPKLIKYARELIENPYGLEATISNNFTNIGEWCSEETASSLRYSYLIEADVDFVVRYLVDNRVVPCKWYTVQPTLYSHIIPDTSSRSTNCEAEILVHYSNVKLDPASDSKRPPDYIYLVFDEEWSNTRNLFPSPNHNDMIQIVFKVGTLLKSSKAQWVLFAYKQVPEVEKDFDHVFCYENQADMITDVLKFMYELDPDAWEHQNGNRFDIPYLILRAEYLKIDSCRRLGRSLSKDIYWKKDKVKGFEKWTVFVPGRINLDLLRRTQDDYPGIEDHSLNGLSKKFKLNETKAELPYDRITVSQRTPAGRRNIAIYCKKDVRITDRLVNDVLKILLVAIETAKMSGIPITSALNRAQGYKVEGGIRHECNRILYSSSDPQIMSLEENEFVPIVKVTNKKNRPNIVKILDREGFEEWESSKEYKELIKKKPKMAKGKGYKGATVIRPRKGFYCDEIVLTLDFSSMYPSIIMFNNLCFTTLVSKDEIKRKNYVWKQHYWSLPKLKITDGKLKEEEDPEAPAFLMPWIREGVLPRLERKWKDERSRIRSGPMKTLNIQIESLKKEIIVIIRKLITGMTKKDVENIDNSKDPKKEWGKLVEDYIENHPNHPVNLLLQQYQGLDARQQAIKIVMNSLYGITGFADSMFYCSEIAKTITGEGRNMLLKTKFWAEKKFNKKKGYPFDLVVIYGDTDSVFTWLKGLSSTSKLGSIFGPLIAKIITAKLRKPNYDTVFHQHPPYNPYSKEIDLTFEKEYDNLNLILAKNYEGLKNELAKAAPEFDAKGLQMLKRRLCQFIKNVLKKVSELLCVDNNLEDGLKHARKMLGMLRERKVSIPELVNKERLSKDLSEYGLEKDYFDKKTKTTKTRKTTEGVAVVLSKKEWEKQKLWATEMGLDLDSSLIRPAGAGDVVQYVFVKKIWGKSKKKSKKSEIAMDPIEALNTNAEIDYEEYISVLETQLCTILRHPVNKFYPGGITLEEDSSKDILKIFKEAAKEENSDEEKSDEENENDETEDGLTDVIDITSEKILTEEDLKKLKKREDKIEKLMDKKVIRILYEGKPKPAVISDKNRQHGAMYNFVKIPDICAICNTTKLEKITIWSKNKTICTECGKDGTSVVKKKFKDTLREKEAAMEQTWKTCETCMGVTRDQTLDCTALSCANMTARNVRKTELEDLYKRDKNISLAW